MNKTAILVPVYQAELSPLERYSLDYTLASLQNRDIFFIAPESLQTAYYQEQYPQIQLNFFSDHFFASVAGYSKLLLDVAFYERYAAYEFVLIVQTDAVILKDDLEYWENKTFDYIGAPWPQGMNQLINVDRFGGDLAKKVRAHVGNGGLSLRRVNKCIQLLKEFPQAVELYRHLECNEDGFFSILGQLSHDFVLPNEMTAGLFSLELKPEYYQAANRQDPMGIHGWWKYNPEFCLQRMKPTPPISDVVNFLSDAGRHDEANMVAAAYSMQDNGQNMT
jgi:hypothetical protein